MVSLKCQDGWCQTAVRFGKCGDYLSTWARDPASVVVSGTAFHHNDSQLFTEVHFGVFRIDRT